MVSLVRRDFQSDGSYVGQKGADQTGPGAQVRFADVLDALSACSASFPV
jgi:hypothetical protein